MKKNNAHAYMKNHFTSMSPGQIVLALYDGAISALDHGTEAFNDGDVARRGSAITKAIAILGELQVALNREAGPHEELATSLDALYHYMIHELSNANLQDKPQPLLECKDLLSGIRDAWAQMLQSLNEEEATANPSTSFA